MALEHKLLFEWRFVGVLGAVFGDFWTILVGFEGFEEESNFEAEVGSRKSGSRFTKGTRNLVLGSRRGLETWV